MRLCLPHQQFRFESLANSFNLQTKMANRVVFQMDQAKPQNQVILRHIEKCRTNPNLDCHDLLSAFGLYQVPNQIKEVPARFYEVNQGLLALSKRFN